MAAARSALLPDFRVISRFFDDLRGMDSPVDTDFLRFIDQTVEGGVATCLCMLLRKVIECGHDFRPSEADGKKIDWVYVIDENRANWLSSLPPSGPTIR